ncbi:MAG: serine/threonine-protein kinase [Verrucomicrobiales bacterium]|nr:serine/threonine-protein kinase [Verrucomicrobiales bacterium]
MKRKRNKKPVSSASQNRSHTRKEAREIDRICDEYEKARAAEQAVSIDAYVDAAPESAQLSLLMALLGVEAEMEEKTAQDQPSVLSRYTIQGDLGSGGMGKVYLAHDHESDSDVALKFLVQDVSLSNDGKKRFLREARLMGKIDHPNVMPLLEVGERAGCPYIAMPVCSHTLADRLETGPTLSPRQIIRIGKEVATGLAEIHKHGFTHRDIKPANIGLMNYDEKTDDWERTVLMDFGLAVTDGNQNTISDVSLTRTGMLLGTVPYMSPEQAESPDNADARSDIFSLGCTLYECACGQRPFTGPSQVSILVRLGKDRPSLPSAKNPSIPKCLSLFILRLLEKSPEKRPQNAERVINELTRLQPLVDPARDLSGVVNKVVWHTDERVRSAVRTIRYTPRQYQAIASISLLLVAGILFSLLNSIAEARTVTVGMKQWIGYTPLAVAKEMDLFPGSSTIEFADVGTVEDMHVNLSNESIDVAMVLVDTLVRQSGSYAKRKDSPDRPTAILKIDTSRGSDGIVASQDVKNVSDFSDERRFIYQHNDVSHFLLNILCQQQQIDFKDIMRFGIEADPGRAAKQFLTENSQTENRQVCAAGTYDPHLTNLLGNDNIEAHLLIDSDSDNTARDTVVDIMICKHSYLEKNEARINDLLQGWFEAIHILTTPGHARHQEAINLAYRFNGYPETGNWSAHTWTQNIPCEKDEYQGYLNGLQGRDRKIKQPAWPDRKENIEFFYSTGNGSSKFHDVFNFCKQFYSERNLGNLDPAWFDGSNKIFNRGS